MKVITVVAAAALIAAVVGVYIWTEDVGAASSVLTVAAVLGVWATVHEMRVDRIERNRPVVLVDFVSTNKGAVYFQVMNIGAGPASDCKVSFDPSPSDYRGAPLSTLPMFQNPLRNLPPGKEFRQFFNVSHSIFKGETVRAFTVRVEYRGAHRRVYRDSFTFDFDAWRQMTLPPRSTAEATDRVGDELEQVRRLLERESRRERVERTSLERRSEPSPGRELLRLVTRLLLRTGPRGP